MPHPGEVTAPNPSPHPLLSLEHIAKRFGRVDALSDASLHARPATVHALLGENGAGKTTLMRIAFGELRPDSGTIRIDGNAVQLTSPADALARGIGMVHQHFTAVPAMTVAENVALASGTRGRFRPAEARDLVLKLCEEVGFTLDPGATAAELSVGMQQRLEIVKALARGARVLILDEPTAVLAPPEVEDLLAMLRRFASRGNAAVIITHKLREALSVADDITVLRHGRTTLSAPAAATDSDQLTAAMLGASGLPPVRGDRSTHVVIGRAIGGTSDGGTNDATSEGDASISITGAAERSEPTERTDREAVIDARDLVLTDDRGVARVRGATLTVHAGEILGVAGVEGAGQHELLRALGGRLKPTSGSLRAPARIGFIPEDRQRDALVLNFSLAENVALALAGPARGRIDWSAIERRTGELVERYGIVASGVRAPVSSLSGGNQQKLVLARELDGAPRALVAENPTRGLDIAATAALQRQLLEAREAGMAIVLYSSDLDEVLALADRLVVMFEGRSTEVPLDRDAVGRAMLGAA
ncbi:MAG TPA: ABC transporter ATP-binding protein [Gemmatimonadaceae bacterium]|nr:ABC transporter ATP-binding protein [Gemmatimonadaceae bacterium]